MKTKLKKIIVVTVMIVFSITTFAQKELIEDYSNKFSNGDIISSNNGVIKGKLYKSNIPYDNNIIGVYYKEVKENFIIPNPFFIEGVSYVKYNSENGKIKMGDVITSSSEPGVAMKATQSGMILGIALEDATSPSGLIKIRVLVQYLKQ